MQDGQSMEGGGQEGGAQESRAQGGKGKMFFVIVILVGVLGAVYALTDGRLNGGEGSGDNMDTMMTKEAGNGENIEVEDGKGPGNEILERAGMQ